MMRRVFCNTTAALLALLVMAPAVVLLSDRTAPIIFRDGGVTPPNPEPGDPVSIWRQGTVVRECEGIVHRVVSDANGQLFSFDPVLTIFFQNPNDTIFTRQVMLPRGMSPGPALYRPRATYWCNWLQRFFPFTIEVAPVPFTVAAPSRRMLPPIQLEVRP